MELIKNFQEQQDKISNIYNDKAKVYGASWCVMRYSSFLTQLYIKAYRIKTIEEQDAHVIDDDAYTDFQGIANYAVKAILAIKHELSNMNESAIKTIYLSELSACHTLVEAKNTDYGDVWKFMEQSDFTDFILVKIERLRNIHKKSTHITDNLTIMVSILRDIHNYAIFACIYLNNKK